MRYSNNLTSSSLAMLAVSVCFTATSFASPGDGAKVDQPVAEIDSVLDGIDARYDVTANIAGKLWDWAEVGYQEERSSNLLQTTLKEEGFKIDAGVADIPTAFTATYGNGGPVIAILAEFDALPGINQSNAPERSPIEGKNAGHACGHNLFGAGSVQAAMAIAEWLEATGTPGTVRLYGTPAEEGGSGKVYMVRAGLFDDVDIALHWHANEKNSAAAKTSLANRSAKFRFRGTSAHAAAAPERGRSALDGVEAMNMMVNMMHEHIPQEARIHYVITEGGSAPNVVPDFAEVFYYARHPKASGVEEIWKRMEQAARGAAMGTGTEVDWEIIHGNNPLLVNEPLARMMDEKLRQVGGVIYTPKEQEFAEKIAASFDSPEMKLGSEKDIQPFETLLGSGSTDVGDVSFAVPTVGLSTATWVPGTSAHSWQAVAASGSSIGHKGTQVAAKTLTLAAIELYTNEALRDEAREAFDVARGEGYEYYSLLGDREAPLDYRK
jgi:aminobenzoyl-glutamate utilization protein B